MISQNNDIFKIVINILKKNSVNYWVCHGTLLGIIRDNKLLSWDSDIDFAVWEDEYTKEDILEIFSQDNRFKLEIVPEEINSLHFSILEYRVDINFYSRDTKLAFIKWSALPKNNSFKILYFIIEFISNDKNFEKSLNFKIKNLKGLIKYTLALPLYILRIILPKSLKLILYKSMINKLDLIGYSFPLELMKFKYMKFLNTNIVVPIDSEKVLKHTYGESWNVPKKNYVWYEEANNLFRQN